MRSVDTSIGRIDLPEDPWADLRVGIDDRSPLPRLCYAATRVVMSNDYAKIDHAPDRRGGGDEIAANIDWDATMDLQIGRAHV